MNRNPAAQATKPAECLRLNRFHRASGPNTGSCGVPPQDMDDREGKLVEPAGKDACAKTFGSAIRRHSVRSNLSVVLFLIAAAVMKAALPQLHALLIYDRGAIEQGQLWRLFTCHLAHWSPSHLTWNLVVLAALGWAARNESSRPLAHSAFWSILMIGPVLFLCEVSMLHYAGLSGVVTATFVCFACKRMRSTPDERLFWSALLISLCGKIAVEFANPSPLFATSDAIDIRVAPLAHLTGAAAGLLGLARLSRLNLRAPVMSARHSLA